jgi:phosphoserine phosphatase SerB
LQHNVTFAALVTLTPQAFTEGGFFTLMGELARRWDATLTCEIKDTYPQETLEQAQSLEDAPYPNRHKFAATVLDRRGLQASFLSAWTALLLRARISIERMRRLNDPTHGLICIDYKLSVPNDVDHDALRAQLYALSHAHGTDVALQEEGVFRRHKRLVVFDMDSTLVKQEVIDEIAKKAGVVDQVAKITERAMNGEIDFTTSLRERVALLNGTPVDVLDQVKQLLTFTPGARVLCRALKRIGFKLAVISGGFMPLALHVKRELGLDYAFANQLKVSADGTCLTGETVGPVIDGARKAELLQVIAQAESVSLDQVIAIGDGANDLPMLAVAGLGVAFQAKPIVQERAKTRINQQNLRYVLYLLGYTDDEAKQLLNEDMSEWV